MIDVLRCLHAIERIPRGPHPLSEDEGVALHGLVGECLHHELLPQQRSVLCMHRVDPVVTRIWYALQYGGLQDH